MHALTEVLQMECRPFNVDVMLVVPGAIKSNIASNQATSFSLPPDSLYGKYLHNILDRMHSSQGANSMPGDKFARIVVGKALASKPSFYVTAGGGATLFAILAWLPRSLVMFLMWRRFSKPA